MARRQSIYVEGFAHANPIPAGCRLGNLLVSGIVYGLDPATGKVAPSMEAQCSLMFKHVRSILAAAGGSTDDIAKVTVYLKDRSQRGALNQQWQALFPDEETRPVRQAMEANLTDGKLIQCDFLAVLSDEPSV